MLDSELNERKPVINSEPEKEETGMPESFWEPLAVILNEIKAETDQHGSTEEQRMQLFQFVFDTLNDRVGDLILFHLEKDQSLLNQYRKLSKPEELLKFLERNIGDFKEKISQLAQTTKADILAELVEI